MATISEPSIFQSLFQSALEEYEGQTGINLVGHPLAVQLEHCNSVESIAELLHDQARNFRQFRGNDHKLMTMLTHTVRALHMFSGLGTLGGAFGFIPLVNTIHTSIGALLSAVQDVSASYDALVDLLEAIYNFLKRLEIYTTVRPTPAMTETIVKILAQLISTLAVATKQIKQGRLKKFAKKLFGENDVEMVLHRLDRLTLDESRATAAQTLEVVHGLVTNLKEVMSDQEASKYDIQKALEMMQQLVNGMNESKREQLRQNVRSWLSPPDPWKNYDLGRETHHDGTAQWFIQGDTFAEWKLSSHPFLWVHGKPGAGKSLLCSSIIKEIDRMRESGLASLGFYYFDFRDDEKKHRSGLLSSLLFQLCDQSDTYCDILSRLYLYFTQHGGSQCPNDSELAQCLEDMLRSPGQAPVYLVIDALDECPDSFDTPSPRENVLKLVEHLVNLRLPNLRICLTSRPEVDIKVVLDHLVFRSISLHDEEGQKQDILDYITSVVHTDRQMQRWRAEDRKRVIDELSQKANGMFRWVFCQLDFLRRCLPARIERALAELPKTLDDTYQRTLLEISEANWEFAHRLLQCVAVASRPLRVEELAEFLAFDFKQGPIPRFHESFRLEDPVEAVLSTCPNLLSIINVYGSEVIQFPHFSVKEYLMSARLAEGSDIMSRRYHISMTSAHTLAAQACLGMLLHLDENVNSDRLERFPLAKYAAEHWVDHVQSEDVSRSVEAGLKDLFDPRKSHLSVWLWIHNPKDPFRYRGENDKTPSQPNARSLHYAALCGLHRIIQFLVIDHRQDVNSLGFEDELTPLHAAVSGSYFGAVSVTRVLLEFGADVMAQDQYGCTPLHHAAGCWSSQAMKVIQVLLVWGADATAQDKDGRIPLHHATGSESSQATEVIRALLGVGADATTKDKGGHTPLHEVAVSGSSQPKEVIRMLLEGGADVMAKDNHGHTPLHHAVGSLSSQATEVVRALLEEGADAMAQDEEGCTPLHQAAWSASLQAMEVTRALLERGADVMAKDKYGHTPLHEVAVSWSSQPKDVIRALLDGGADATAQDKDWCTPLHHAAGSQSSQAMEVVRALLEGGADAMAQDKDGRTPLHHALGSESSQATGVIRALLEGGADASATDKDGHTPLHEVAGSWSPQLKDVMRALLEGGVDATARDKDGRSPLHHAAGSWFSQAMDVIRALLEGGADATAEDKHGRTPLHYAAGSSSPQVTEVVRALLEGGADTTAQDKNGCTALHEVAGSPSAQAMKVVQVLLEAGADATAQDKDGCTPLHQAVGSSSSQATEVVRALLEVGADVTVQDKNGRTPLHRAARSSFSQAMEVVQALLEGGADATAQDKDGRTPLHHAVGSWSSQVMEIVRALFEAGADATAQDNDGHTPFHQVAGSSSLQVMKVMQALPEWGTVARAQDNDGHNMWLTDIQKFTIGLTSFGAFFVMLGVMLFFRSVL